ncbi:unnamed protein product, partial [Prorocentrum cordatum]
AFAHSRDEIRLPLLTLEEEDQRPAALSNEFFTHRFKTLWCPIGVQHDWQTCVYAHNYQDARRHPGIGYGPRPCPHWKRQETSLEYSERCPHGVRCPFSHGAKEQLYHPAYFKTVTCQDSPNASCPRGQLCAFWHKRSQQRPRPTARDEYKYKAPICEDKLGAHLQQEFLTPPFKLLNALHASMQAMSCGPCDGSQDVLVCMPCDSSQGAPLQEWGRQACGPTGAATPTTQATQSPATDSDEAGSAVGSDKAIPAQDEDGADAVVFGSFSGADVGAAPPPTDQGPGAWQAQAGGPEDPGGGMVGLGPPWSAQVCFGDAQVVPAFAPGTGDCGGSAQVLFYAQVPHQQAHQFAMAPAAPPVACAPEAAYEIMVPVGAVGEVVPGEGACAVPQLGEAAALMHGSFARFQGQAGAVQTSDDDDDDDLEVPARGRPRALSH